VINFRRCLMDFVQLLPRRGLPFLRLPFAYSSRNFGGIALRFIDPSSVGW